MHAATVAGRWAAGPHRRHGKKKTLRLVARYADACNLFDAGPDVIASKLDVLARHCEDASRDPASVQKTVITATDPLTDVDSFVTAMSAYAALGVSKVWIGSRGPDLPGWVTRVGELVAPRLHDL